MYLLSHLLPNELGHFKRTHNVKKEKGLMDMDSSVVVVGQERM